MASGLSSNRAIRRSSNKTGVRLSLNPSQIFAAIEAQPPLMREEAKAKYLGKQVKWTLTFLDGRLCKDGQAHLTFHFDPDNIRMVSGDVSIARYPRLRSMQPGESLHVRGAIRKIDTLCIELEIRDLAFAKTEVAGASH